MPISAAYTQIRDVLQRHVGATVPESTLERITLLVVGILKAESAAPARIARALHQLGLSQADIPSIERRLRRIENDPLLTATLWLHPFARERLLLGRPRELLLVLDPTTQDDRLVMVSVAGWYRGRALPLAWMIWPAQTPLTGARFGERMAALLELVAPLLPPGLPITGLADRAFGTPVFLDVLTARGWHYVVRVQDQTRCCDPHGRIVRVRDVVSRGEQRVKWRGRVFKKRGWRTASIVVYWGVGYSGPLCLVSDWPPQWQLLRLYQRRYPLEATFRDYKTHGWHWESGQVTDLAHMERLLVGMALATWLALLVGTQVARDLLQRPVTGRRRTLPWAGKRSLFQLGLHRLQCMLHGTWMLRLVWQLTDWEASHWQAQLKVHYVRAWIFAGTAR